MLTQGVASRPVALADQPLKQAEEEQGRVVWSHGRQDAQDGADEGGGEEAYFAAKPSEARDSEVRAECSQGRRDSRQALCWETRPFLCGVVRSITHHGPFSKPDLVPPQRQQPATLV